MYLCLASHKRGIDKHCRPRSDATNVASDQGLHCLHNNYKTSIKYTDSYNTD